jgi:hypothetical protein
MIKTTTEPVVGLCYVKEYLNPRKKKGRSHTYVTMLGVFI